MHGFIAVRLAAAAALLALPISAHAQAGGTAHLYAYQLSDRAAFEAGYREHLGWHARAGDTLVWYAWYVTAGNRVGAFVDGTFGTTPEALAARSDPKGDAAHFAATAGPYARSMGDEGWELWREASSVTPLENHNPGARIQATVFVVSDASAFEEAIRARPLLGASWYRGRKNATASYLLLTAAGDDRVRALDQLFPAAHPARALATTKRAEIWRYAPRMTLFPGKPLVP